MKTPTRISFITTKPAFSIAIRKKVDEYFSSEAIKFTGNGKLFLKTAILYSIAIACYVLLLFCSVPVWLDILICILFGLDLAAMGFNIMHDGAHGSYSPKRWVNELMAYSLNLMGGSSFLWKQKHNVNHHSFTNIEGHDDDIDIQPWIRTNPNQPKRWFHRYQHIYWALLYGMTYLTWVFNKDFGKYFSGKVAGTTIKKMDTREHIIFWTSKLVYVFLFLVLPLIRLGLAETLTGYLITAFVCGWVISIIFQMAHLVEGASFPVPDTITRKVNEDWTIHQLATTANFSTNSKIVSWFSGGLNFQIEHHLFPRISHVHYPAISKLVKEICKQYNVRYIEYPTFFSALKSHIIHLKTVGVQN
jgi:linoleoyl-CoA desaturase